MCNLYTYRLSRDEIRGLMEHYKLVGAEWAEVFEKEMLGKNDEALVYPKYQAPVVIVQGGNRELAHMGWGCRRQYLRSGPARSPSGQAS